MLLTIALIGMALVVFVLPAFKQPSNCGGNSEALSDVKWYEFILRSAAEARPDHEFSIDRATPRELGQLRDLLPGPAGAGFLVSRHAYREPPTGPKRLMIVCDRAFTNVPRRLIGRAPPTHAAAYSDGTCELISVAEFNALDRSELVPLDEMLNSTPTAQSNGP